MSQTQIIDEDFGAARNIDEDFGTARNNVARRMEFMVRIAKNAASSQDTPKKKPKSEVVVKQKNR